MSDIPAYDVGSIDGEKKYRSHLLDLVPMEIGRVSSCFMCRFSGERLSLESNSQRIRMVFCVFAPESETQYPWLKCSKDSVNSILNSDVFLIKFFPSSSSFFQLGVEVGGFFLVSVHDSLQFNILEWHKRNIAIEYFRSNNST